jgi:hypothetical protein
LTVAAEVKYLRTLLDRVGFTQQAPTNVYEDNNTCIEWGNNIIGCLKRAKHIDKRKHFAHKAIQVGHLLFVRVLTASQLANNLTKGLHAPQWQECLKGILQAKICFDS